MGITAGEAENAESGMAVGGGFGEKNFDADFCLRTTPPLDYADGWESRWGAVWEFSRRGTETRRRGEERFFFGFDDAVNGWTRKNVCDITL
jgi:hypothetical protein